MQILKPLIEELAADRLDGNLNRHNFVADTAIAGLRLAKESAERREFLQNRLVDFIELDRYYCQRVLLYLPFYALKEPVPLFRYAVSKAWPKLLKIPDGPERVVKIAHLAPWLLENDYITKEAIFGPIKTAEHFQDESLARSFADVLPCLKARESLSHADLAQMEELLAWLPSRPAQENGERDPLPRVILRDLIGPFTYNLNDDGLEKAESLLDGSNIIRIGGPRLKGYGREGSGYDFYPLPIGAEAEADPGQIHLFFNTVWVGEDKEILLVERRRHALEYMRILRGSDRRRRCLGKLEQDLLLTELLHEGFPSAYPADLSLKTRDFPEMDGTSAFYDDRYRAVASELFIKFVQLPQRY